MATPKLKLGNDKWATKSKSLLAYNDEGNNFKSLPFRVERLSGGSYVGRNGLIQYAATEEPRIDFTNNTKGHLLLEPSRQNKVTYSEQLTTNWTRSSISTPTDADIDAPDGAETVKRLQTNNADGSIAFTYNTTFNQVSGTTYTVSVYAKSFDGTDQLFGLFGNGSGASDAHTGNLTATNEWQRFTYTFTASNTSTIGICKGNDRLAFDILFWGFQIEQGSYATSYIPTTGSTATRIQDKVINGGNEYIFNDSEGVLFLDVEITNNSSEVKQTSLNNGTTNEAVKILQLNSTTFRFEVVMSSGTNFSQDITVNPYQRNKFALQYKANDYKVFINGEKQTITQRSTLPTGLDRFNFNRGYSTTDDFKGSINELEIFNTALTDAELTTLTTL